MNSGKVEEVRGALEGIGEIAHHFSHEEELITRFAHPLRKQHMEAHGSFLADVRRSARAAGGRPDAVVPALGHGPALRLVPGST